MTRIFERRTSRAPASIADRRIAAEDIAAIDRCKSNRPAHPWPSLRLVAGMTKGHRAAARAPITAAAETQQKAQNVMSALIACEYSHRLRSSRQSAGTTVQFAVATLAG
jgi:hypothetical protein